LIEEALLLASVCGGLELLRISEEFGSGFPPALGGALREVVLDDEEGGLALVLGFDGDGRGAQLVRPWGRAGEARIDHVDGVGGAHGGRARGVLVGVDERLHVGDGLAAGDL